VTSPTDFADPASGATWDSVRDSLDKMRADALAMGGPAGIQRQHERGRLTPRERIDLLFDEGSFREIGELVVGTVVVPGRPDRLAPADGIVTGWGMVAGSTVFALADDGTIAAGARGLAANYKADVVTALAKNNNLPLVWFAESSVNRMQHVMGAQFAGDLERSFGMELAARRSWNAPLILAVSGQSVGRPSFATTFSEFTTMVQGTTALALAGPSIVRAATGQDVNQDELGGADLHGRVTGLIDYVAEDEAEAVTAIKQFLEYFPSSSAQQPARRLSDDPPDRLCPELYDIVPLEYRRGYDMRRVVRSLVDQGKYLEVKKNFARNLLCAYARIDGWSVGIVANNPMFTAGVVDPQAIEKLIRFVKICNLYNLPLIFLQDQPGVMVGPDMERQGVFRHVWRMSDLLSHVTTPVLTILIRKGYGFSYLLLGSRSFGGDCVVAWPSASISLAGPEAGLATVLAKEERAGTLTEERRAEVLHDYLDEARAKHAARDGRLDDIIEPARSREFLARQLAIFACRRPDIRRAPKPAVGP
jgi:acetyl-CoA carboxylase carboxyltransferase component